MLGGVENWCQLIDLSVSWCIFFLRDVVAVGVAGAGAGSKGGWEVVSLFLV